MSIENTLLGIAIGDAFGLGIEFQDREWIKSNVDFTTFVDARTGGSAKNYQPGFYSDDTEHSIAVLKALMDKRPFSEDLLLELFKAEYESDKMEKGFPRLGHGSIKGYYEGRKSIQEIREFQRERYDPGNAPPMRSVPLGFVDSNKINNYAIINANATTPHPKARAASILVARAAEYLTVKKEKQVDVIEYCKGCIHEEDTLMFLEAANRLAGFEELDYHAYEILCGPQPISSIGGKKIYGLPAASMRTAVSSLYIVKNAKDAFTGLKQAISLGGDVDSVAAICTGILAGRFGIDSLPKFMLEQVEGREKFVRLAREFENYQLNSGSL